jgi:histidinol-phosphate aminotransferase
MSRRRIVTEVQQVESSTFNIETLVRPAVRAIPQYVPAKLPDDHPPRVIKLDMNESPHGPSPKTRAALESFSATNRYPDFGAIELRRALSAYTGVPAEQIICGAGLDDVINTMFLATIDPGDEVIIHEPTFGVYRALVAHYNGTTINAPLNTDFELDADLVLNSITAKTKVSIICTPNNPTGNSLDPITIERIVANAPCIVAIDEAYAEFAGTSYIPFLDRYPNVVVFRTMSKFAGLAGMRVGYGMFTPDFMPYVKQVAPPFHNIAVASATAAIAALDDLEYLRGMVNRIVADREALFANLREIPGVQPIPSATNFLLIRLAVEDATPVVAGLAQRGILVRNFANPALGIQDCLRVTIGTQEENEIFLDNLEELVRLEGRQA